MKKALSLILCLVLMCSSLTVGASAATVVLSPQNLMVDGQYYNCEKYNIDGSNYFKLRDIAYLLMGTANEFGVGYHEVARSIIVVPGMPYEPVGGELVMGEDKSATAVPSSQTLWFLDAPADDLSVYNIGGNNFFKLRDLGNMFGFEVDYDGTTNTAIVRTVPQSGYGYDPQAVAFDAIWNWVKTNYNNESHGNKIYYEINRWENGEGEVIQLSDDNSEDSPQLVLAYSYHFSDGSHDTTIIYLTPDGQFYYCTYYYYDTGNNVSSSPNFEGALKLYPATFDILSLNGIPIEFAYRGGPLAEDEESVFESMAGSSIINMLLWMENFLSSTDALSKYSICDFGFIIG